VSISGGSTAFGSGTSTIGYLTGSGNLTMTGGSLAMGGELRVGGSDQNGSAYNAAGTVAMANATLAVGALTVARANYLDNSISGTLTLNSGGTLISTNDAILQFAGAGRGKLALNGGNFIVGPTGTRWLMVGFYDSGAGELDITNGTLFLENGTSLKLCRNGNTGGNVVSQIGGNVTFYSDDGVTVGGGGNLDLNYAGAATSTNTYNLNGGTLTVPTITASSGSGASLFNFNGGTLKPTAATATFLQGLTLANIRNSGAKIDTAGWNITINQALKHSAISGDLATDGGLTKNGVGKLIFGSTNTYTGNTGINAGTLVLGSVASIAGSKNIGMAAGASLDVSAVTGGFTLASSQTLYGTGAVNGMVTNNGTIQPGFPLGTMGAMTFSNPPVLNGVMLMNLDRNNGTPLCGQIIVPSGILAYGGTLTVNNIGGPLQARDTFQLFSAAGYGGAFAVTYLPSLNSGLAWSNSLAVNGSLAVVSTVSLVPTNILWSVSGTNLTLSWPQDHTGWRLLMQTNNLVNGISVNTNDWGTVPASQQTNQMILPIDPTMPFEFYRLIFP
jgi:autotransporter-associated beta strand protein